MSLDRESVSGNYLQVRIHAGQSVEEIWHYCFARALSRSSDIRRKRARSKTPARKRCARGLCCSGEGLVGLKTEFLDALYSGFQLLRAG